MIFMKYLVNSNCMPVRHYHPLLLWTPANDATTIIQPCNKLVITNNLAKAIEIPVWVLQEMPYPFVKQYPLIT